MFLFKVLVDNGEPFEVTATSRDVLIWEKTTGKGRSMAQLEKNGGMSDLYALCHVAARRRGLYTGSLQEFQQTCDLDMQDEVEQEEPDPTLPAP